MQFFDPARVRGTIVPRVGIVQLVNEDGTVNVAVLADHLLDTHCEAVMTYRGVRVGSAPHGGCWVMPPKE